MITIILFDRDRPGVIYAGVKPVLDLYEETKGGGLFVTEDDGQNWSELEGMRGKSVRGLVQSVKDTNVLAAAARSGIYYSKDRGKTWERITPTNDPELKGFHSVAMDPRDPNIIYVGTHHLPWKTTDCGQNWKLAGSKEAGMIDDSDIFAIHIDELNPDVVLMSACSGIYRSHDAGARWNKIQGIPYTSRRTHVIYQHPTKPEVVFAGTTEGLWLSTDNGKPESWRRMTSVRLVINAVAVHPDRPDRVFLGTEDNGVLISLDGGESYEASNAGFINRQVRAVLADRTERGRIYAGVIFDSLNGGLFISDDGGISWQQSMSGMGVRDVYSLHQSESNPATIYAGTNHGLFRSDDHGRNWVHVKKEVIEPPPADKSKAGSTTGKSAQPQQQKAADRPVAQQTERTERTESPSPRPRRVTPDQDPIEPVVQTVSIPASKEPADSPKRRKNIPAKSRAKPQTGKSKPASNSKSKQGKAAEQPKPPVDNMIDLESQIFAIVPINPFVPDGSFVPASADGGENPQQERNWLIASTWDGLFRTEDEKKGWREIKLLHSTGVDGAQRSQPKINTIAATPHSRGTVFVGTDQGLFLSRDNGATFKQMLLEEEARRVRSIVFDPRTAETIYVGTSTGFFRSFDGGRSWENRGGGMPLVTDVSAIVISNADPDELYLSDELRGAIYHSKDRGRNWERLDISQLPSLKLWSLASDPFDVNRLYIGSFSGGVYVMSRR
jgi:photosystem II stability/assembly factor-like uncharacterized protein